LCLDINIEKLFNVQLKVTEVIKKPILKIICHPNPVLNSNALCSFCCQLLSVRMSFDVAVCQLINMSDCSLASLFISVYLYVSCPLAWLYYMSVCLYYRLTIAVAVCLFVYVRLPFGAAVCPFIYMSGCPLALMNVRLSIF
jgi:hypothetical protein